MASIEQYFEPEKWETMSEYEKKRHLNVYEIYISMKELGMPLPVPDFMSKCKAKTPDDYMFKIPEIPPLKKPGNKNSNSSKKFQSPSKITAEYSEQEKITNSEKSKKKRISEKNIKKNCKEYEEIVNTFKSNGVKGFTKKDVDYSKLEFLTVEEFLNELLETIKNTPNCAKCCSKSTPLKTPSRYPKRNVKKVNYAETEIRDDCYIYCDICEREYEQPADHGVTCPVHGLLPRLFNKNVPRNPRNVQRAERTLREDWLAIRTSSIKDAGLGVWNIKWLPIGTLLGPYEGEKTKQGNDNGYCWTIVEKGKVSHYIDGENEGVSNWLRYVNCSRNISEQNLMAFQFFGKLYYRVVKDIPPHTELLVYYGNKYASKLGIDTKNYSKPADKPFPNGSFKCSGCVYNFASPLFLEEHQKRCRKYRFYLITSEQNEKPDNKLHKCKLCDYVTPDSEVLLAHVTAAHKDKAGNKKQHESTKEFACEHCTYKTSHSGHLKNHLRTHSGEKPYRCDECQSAFSQYGSLLNHVKAVHNQLKDYACEHCTYKTSYSTSLKNHLRTHSGEKPYRCDECQSTFSQSGHLFNHVKAIHKQLRDYACEHCTYKTSNSTNLKNHLRTHSGEKPYKCDKCQSAFSHSGTLFNHVKTVHKQLKDYACEHCTYKTSSSSHLKDHMRTHSGEKSYQCDECQSAFSRSDNPSKHVKAVHKQLKDYACEHCTYKTSYSTNLKIHLRTHSGEKSYRCDKCQSTFSLSSSLFNHVKAVHKQLKDYACEHCTYKTSKSTNLKIHLRTHSGEKSYQCDKCQSAFSQFGSLSRHVKAIHDQLKDYACEHCTYKTSNSTNLKKHLRTHSGEKP